MTAIAYEFAYSLKSLQHAPAFTSAAVATLALGTGATIALFSVVYGILLRPLPYEDAAAIVLVQREQLMAGAARSVPAPFFRRDEMTTWQEGLRAFQSSAFYAAEVAALATEAGSELIDSAVVSDSFFTTLG